MKSSSDIVLLLLLFFKMNSDDTLMKLIQCTRLHERTDTGKCNFIKILIKLNKKKGHKNKTPNDGNAKSLVQMAPVEKATEKKVAVPNSLTLFSWLYGPTFYLSAFHPRCMMIKNRRPKWANEINKCTPNKFHTNVVQKSFVNSIYFIGFSTH